MAAEEASQLPRRPWSVPLRLPGTPDQRTVAVAWAALPVTLLLAVGKVALLASAPSLFLAANVQFALVAGAAKYLLLRAHRAHHSRRALPANARERHHVVRAYRLTGVLLVTASALLVVACVPLLAAGGPQARFERWPAIGVATVAFVEMGLSLGGVMAAKHSQRLLAEAVTLVNLATAAVLMVLAQAALLSFTHEGDASPYNAMAGILFGALAAAVGVHMLRRRLAAETSSGSR